MSNRTIVSLLMAVSLWWACFASHAAVFTVGPGGTHATLQAAFDAAGNNGQDDEIRIQVGQYATEALLEYSENLSLDISGGWDGTFSNRDEDPGLTVLSGTQSTQVLNMEIAAGTVTLHWVTLTDGAASIGAGLEAEVSGTANFYLQDSIIRDNIASGTDAASAGGVSLAVLGDHANLYVDRVRVWNNIAQADDAMAGGMLLYVEDGDVALFDVDIASNQVIGSSMARAGGLFVDNGSVTSDIRITKSRIRNNSVAAASASGAGAWLTLNGISSQFKLLSSRVEGNADGSAVPSAFQILVESDSASIQFRDLAITRGVGTGGLHVLTEGGAQLLLVNATLAGNSGDGLRHEHNGSATQIVQNSILFANAGVNRQIMGAGPRFESVNLVDVDPSFADPTNDNYRLSAASLNAINLGFNAPVGSLGQRDADFMPRVVGTTVDIGAFEYLSIEVFKSGFE